MQDTTNFVQIHSIRKADYQDVWDFQGHLLQKLVHSKRKLNEFPFVHHLIFCEHTPVYTIGKSGDINHLLYDKTTLDYKGIDVYHINRGGDITYHGPGQLTVYPIFNLELLFRDLHKYIRLLEECIIELLSEYHIDGKRIEEYTGVWVDNGSLNQKICAIGVHMSRWVSMHGLAFNVNTNLEYFKGIIPCGINDEDKDVCSLASLHGKPISMDEVEDKLKYIICNTFKMKEI